MLVLIGLVTSVVSSLGAPLLPTIARVDHVTLGTAQWSLTVAMLAGAVTAPVLGRLGDGPARRPLILGSLGVVGLGCLVCALPFGGFALLILGRGMQGVGLGLMPLTMAVARDRLPGERAVRVVALLSVATAAGVGLGYPVTGVLEEAFGLRAPFWFGVAVAVFTLGAGALVIPTSDHLRRRPLDVAGAVLLGGALLAVLVAVTEGSSWGWTSGPVMGLILTFAVLAAGWIVRERAADHPLVDLALLRHPAVAVTNATALLVALAIYMFLPLLTDFVQTPPSAGYGFGASVTVTGLMLLPFSVLSTSMSRVAGLLGDRFGRARVVPLGALVMGAALLVFVVGGGAIWEGFLAMGVAGVGVGFTFAAMPGLIVGSVPAAETGSALGFYQVVRFVGFAVGSGLSASVLAAYTPAGHALPQRAGVSVAMTVGAVVCAVAALAGACLRPGADPKGEDGILLGGEPAAEVVFE